MGVSILKVMEQHLESRHWLALDQPTIADIACYPYVALAPEGGMAIDGYPAIQKWMASIKNLPGYVGMAGID